MQALTLEIILRAVFGLDRVSGSTRCASGFGELLAFGDHPLSLLRPAGRAAEPSSRRSAR